MYILIISIEFASLKLIIMVNKDTGNIVLLIILYCLQGVPLALGLASLPYLLKKHASFHEIATFSLAAYPFSLKFLWSPFVDSYYFQSIGRRLSWIIPLQIASGILMISLSYSIDDMLISPDHIGILTCYMFLLILIYATQDIAVDGWAVELLQPENKPYASMTQTIGQTIGYFMSFTFLLALHSTEFCNSYIFAEEQDAGLISISGYLRFWGYISIVISLFLVFKHERPTENNLTVKEIYIKVYACIKSKNYQNLIAVLLTSRLGTAFNDSALMLVLSEKGLNESQLGILSLIMTPVGICITGLVSLYLKKNESYLAVYYQGLVLKIFCCFYGLFILQIFPIDKVLTPSFYALLILGNICSSIAMNLYFVAICGFFNKIADESMTGTILTFLNAINNLGASLPRYAIFQAISALTIEKVCIQTGCPDCMEECTEGRHGYYPLAAISLSFAVIYIFILKRLIQKVDSYPENSWKIEKIIEKTD